MPGESPWTEEPGGLQSMWSKRARQDWATNQSTSIAHASLKTYFSFLSSLNICMYMYVFFFCCSALCGYNSSFLLYEAVVHLFSSLCSVSLYEYPRTYWSILLLMGFWLIFILKPLWRIAESWDLYILNLPSLWPTFLQSDCASLHFH